MLTLGISVGILGIVLLLSDGCVLCPFYVTRNIYRYRYSKLRWGKKGKQLHPPTCIKVTTYTSQYWLGVVLISKFMRYPNVITYFSFVYIWKDDITKWDVNGRQLGHFVKRIHLSACGMLYPHPIYFSFGVQRISLRCLLSYPLTYNFTVFSVISNFLIAIFPIRYKPIISYIFTGWNAVPCRYLQHLLRQEY